MVDAGELDLKGINFQFKTLDQLGIVALTGEKESYIYLVINKRVNRDNGRVSCPGEFLPGYGSDLR